MSTKFSAGRVRSTYEFIKANRATFSVQVMCRVLGVAPSGYYEWITRPISKRAQEDARLVRLIHASFTASHGIYGAPRVFLDLREAGETCSKHRVARLMRVNHLRALHGYRTQRWSVGKPSVLVPNRLKRQFYGDAAKQGMGHGYHLPDLAGLALLGRHPGSVLAQDRRRVDAADASPGARARRRADGRTSAASLRYADSFRPSDPVRQ